MEAHVQRERAAGARLLSLGSANVDFQVRVPRWPGPGETMPAERFLRIPGGKAFNRAWLARRLGVEAAIFARVGDDDLADEVIDALEEAGVDTGGLRRVEGCATAVSMIVTRHDGDKSIVLAANANERWSEEDARSVVHAIDSAPRGSVLSCDLEVPPRVVRLAAEAARRRGMRVVLDPSPSDRLDDALLGLATHLTPNAGEAERLVGYAVERVEDGVRAGRALRARGADAVLVKLGRGGCVVVDASGADLVRIDEVDAVDTTGAGDAFAGALAVALVRGASLREAARAGVVAASLAVRRFGSCTSYPSRDELERALADAA